MSNRVHVERYLVDAPASVRQAMLDAKTSLAPGAAAVVGRFFKEIKAQGASFDSPPGQVFEAVARSESTLAILLRTLAKYAPHVSTFAGRELRKGYYRNRGSEGGPKETTGRSQGLLPLVAPASWPLEWRCLYPALAMSPSIKTSSKKRYVASVSRCAEALKRTPCDAVLTFHTAFLLGEAFLNEGIKHKTIAGYLGGLVSLGKFGGAPCKDLDGVRSMVDYHLELADDQEKAKQSRIERLMGKGGFEFIAQRISQTREEANGLPDHLARKHHLRQSAAILGVLMNKPGRTGDVSGWVIGRDLIRHASGLWELEWYQEKTGYETSAGPLWDEVSELIDEMILAGRPDRHIHLRYDELLGKNWLTLSEARPYRNLPSQRTIEVIGVPSQDLRTLAADYLRQWDPSIAANIIQTHLGHRTRKAGEQYRALCESDVADRSWKDLRSRIRAGALH